MATVPCLTSGRLLGLAALACAGVLALPLALRADPATPPVGAAPAQPPLTVQRPEMPDMSTRREAHRARMLDARIERLHAGLQLTTAQDAMWPAVADAIRGFVEARGIHFRQQLDAAPNTNDGLKMRGAHMARVGAAMGRLADATKPLVATLTPDQKSRLPALLEHAGPKKMLERAFEVPLPAEADAGVRGIGGAPASSPPRGTAATPGKAPGDAGTMPQKDSKDPDDDDQ